jgi:LacI family transcriptional regulator
MRDSCDAAKPSLTIRDVARLSGVSASTVSRVLNGNPRVSLPNRAAVRAVIEHVKYRPSSSAQGLARGRSRTFGVLTQDITSEFYGQILKGIVLALGGTGYRPIFTTGSPEDEAGEPLELLLRNRVEAMIIVGRFEEDRIRQAAAETPLLNIGPTIPGLEGRCVIVDNVGGAYEATRHLIDLGHRRIAHIAGPPYHRHSSDRLKGFERALSDARRKVEPRLVVEGDFSDESGERAVHGLLDRGVAFTAIFAANDCMAYGAMHALVRRGFRVPRDVSIVGFDDRPHSAHVNPALTTMRQPSAELGTAAVEGLLRELRGEPLAAPTFKTPLMLRESTAKPPAVNGQPHGRRFRPGRSLAAAH